MARRKAADSVAIEGIDDQNNDRQIDEREDQRGVDSEQRRAALAQVEDGAHSNDQRFSTRWVSDRSARVMIRMNTEMAAPSGQS